MKDYYRLLIISALSVIIVFYSIKVTEANGTECENTCATISSEMDIHIPEIKYNTSNGIMSLWADFQFAGESGGDLFWKLSNFGEKNTIQPSYHPAYLKGTWNYTATYTDISSEGDPSEWDWSSSITLNADGTIGSGTVKGYWWAYSDMLIITHPWQDNQYYGVACSFLNLKSETQAIGTFEDKNLSGTGWWGRGTASMVKQ